MNTMSVNIVESVNLLAINEFGGNVLEAIKTYYEDILAAFRGLTRPLSEEEKKIGRIAAHQHGVMLKDQCKRSADELRAVYMKQLKNQGYSEHEASEKLRIEELQHREDIGLGKSQRCRFVWL